MPDYVDPLSNFIESARQCWSFLSGFICRLTSRPCTDLVGSTFGSSSKLVIERKIHNSAVMAAMDPIILTSSDSELEDWDLEDYGQQDASPPRSSSASAAPRILPDWASECGTSTRGYDGPPQKDPFPKRASASNGFSSNVNHHAQAKLQMLPSPTDDIRSTDLQTVWVQKSKYSTDNDYGKSSSQQALKRVLPSSLRPSMPSARSSNLIENAESSQISSANGKSSYSERPNLTNNKNYMKDHFGRGGDEEVMMYETSGNRILPPSLMHGKSVSTTQYFSSNDPGYRSGISDDRAAGNDERLIYQAALQDLNQPKIEASLPDGLLSVSLLRHQKIALAWMLQKETRSLHCLGGILADDQGLGKTISMIALIQMQKSLQCKSKSEDLFNKKTEALNLDDDDDNGSSAPDKTKKTGESNDLKLIPDVSPSVREFRRRRPAAGTLVVCPASVLRQWARELDDKVADGAKLSVLIYHGSNRTKDPVELATYDVVLTTYAIVTNEVPKQPLVDEEDDDQKDGEKFGLSTEFSTNKKRKKTSNIKKRGKKGKKGLDSSAIDCDSGALARVGWFRVILDEAQTIKNHRTQVARACCGLRAKRRWCLSGTPIQNAIDELYSYFRFLKYDPYAVFKSFCYTIKIPISRNSLHGYKKLQAVLRAIMLRRTKGTLIDGEPIINLPPKTIHLIKVDFSAEERTFYRKLEAESRSKFKAYAAAGTVNQNYANILLMLLRLRQACDHPFLVKGFNSDSVERVSLDMAKSLPRDMLINLLNLLETNLTICRICNDPPEDAVVTMCGHVFCRQCVSEFLTGDDNTCPASECKEQLGADVVFSKATLRSCMSDDFDSYPSSSFEFAEKSIVMQSEYSSSKIRAALEILQSHCVSKSPSSEPCSLVRCNGNSGFNAEKVTTVHLDSQAEGPIKAIVFSQWTSMLDLVEFSLNESCIPYRRLDGTMTLGSRDRAVKEFNTDPEVTVMLMSLKAGNLGLNMVAACHVILLDLWWNPTTEDQAVDRAHRIGQTRPVTVSRITVKDTVEDRILALQEEKRKMVASAFGEDQSGGSATRLTVEDLKYLFMV
ncbi:helicase-like transcription factor CHR28 [Cornus florida]|uniref:helicase-like transcription factor CHR28 n=1 Tax=Cornus florida TaxID=4283 RepID=UPI00289DC84C|nr:helicase-like transcription factor CHR28 [Cornus florida]XP_059649856.1 helicase-like transcription factor CHR28 [Cornus florida]XP_059649857.1 helicase-like transcription factor CHR28 [Cornus florida]XP_059649858.1 helicase-like transcription factor CHR28 [Cornus florida]